MYHTNPNSGALAPDMAAGKWVGHGANQAQGACLGVAQDTMANALIRDLDVALDIARQLGTLQSHFLERVLGPSPETTGGLKSSDSSGLLGLITEKMQVLHQILNLTVANQIRIDKIA